MTPIDVVLDTNVVIAAMRSNRGASFRVLSLVGDERFRIAISVPLMVEYEAVALRTGTGIPLEPEDILAILDRICALGRRVKIFFQWRPHLPDP
jgi:predicted nucleic acid-binding protein